MESESTIVHWKQKQLRLGNGRVSIDDDAFIEKLMRECHADRGSLDRPKRTAGPPWPSEQFNGEEFITEEFGDGFTEVAPPKIIGHAFVKDLLQIEFPCALRLHKNYGMSEYFMATHAEIVDVGRRLQVAFSGYRIMSNGAFAHGFAALMLFDFQYDDLLQRDLKGVWHSVLQKAGIADKELFIKDGTLYDAEGGALRKVYL